MARFKGLKTSQPAHSEYFSEHPARKKWHTTHQNPSLWKACLQPTGAQRIHQISIWQSSRERAQRRVAEPRLETRIDDPSPRRHHIDTSSARVTAHVYRPPGSRLCERPLFAYGADLQQRFWPECRACHPLFLPVRRSAHLSFESGRSPHVGGLAGKARCRSCGAPGAYQFQWPQSARRTPRIRALGRPSGIAPCCCSSRLVRGQCHELRVAALMVTHDPDLLSLADRAVHIGDGRLMEIEVRHATH